jgi:hypothetical protein
MSPQPDSVSSAILTEPVDVSTLVQSTKQQQQQQQYSTKDAFYGIPPPAKTAGTMLNIPLSSLTKKTSPATTATATANTMPFDWQRYTAVVTESTPDAFYQAAEQIVAQR